MDFTPLYTEIYDPEAPGDNQQVKSGTRQILTTVITHTISTSNRSNRSNRSAPCLWQEVLDLLDKTLFLREGGFSSE